MAAASPTAVTTAHWLAIVHEYVSIKADENVFEEVATALAEQASYAAPFDLNSPLQALPNNAVARGCLTLGLTQLHNAYRRATDTLPILAMSEWFEKYPHNCKATYANSRWLFVTDTKKPSFRDGMQRDDYAFPRNYLRRKCQYELAARVRDHTGHATAILVYGASGSGKTTLVMTLPHELCTPTIGLYLTPPENDCIAGKTDDEKKIRNTTARDYIVAQVREIVAHQREATCDWTGHSVVICIDESGSRPNFARGVLGDVLDVQNSVCAILPKVVDVFIVIVGTGANISTVGSQRAAFDVFPLPDGETAFIDERLMAGGHIPEIVRAFYPQLYVLMGNARCMSIVLAMLADQGILLDSSGRFVAGVIGRVANKYCRANGMNSTKVRVGAVHFSRLMSLAWLIFLDHLPLLVKPPEMCEHLQVLVSDCGIVDHTFAVSSTGEKMDERYTLRPSIQLMLLAGFGDVVPTSASPDEFEVLTAQLMAGAFKAARYLSPHATLADWAAMLRITGCKDNFALPGVDDPDFLLLRAALQPALDAPVPGEGDDAEPTHGPVDVTVSYDIDAALDAALEAARKKSVDSAIVFVNAPSAEYADVGMSLVTSTGTMTVLVQCKRYAAWKYLKPQEWNAAIWKMHSSDTMALTAGTSTSLWSNMFEDGPRPSAIPLTCPFPGSVVQGFASVYSLYKTKATRAEALEFILSELPTAHELWTRSGQKASTNVTRTTGTIFCKRKAIKSQAT